MRHETGKVYCLVRSSGQTGSREGDGNRLGQVLQYYFGGTYKNEIGRRIIPLIGDITDDSATKVLRGAGSFGIQTLIHAAADVRHFGNYSRFHSVNVEGTERMLHLAESMGARFLHISTVSIGGMCLDKEGCGKVVFRESDFYIGQNLDNVYLRSKFEAERAVLDAKRDGYDCMIFHAGNLTNRHADGMFQLNSQENAFMRRLKTFIDLKAMLYGYTIYINKSLKNLASDLIKAKPKNLFVVPPFVEMLYKNIWNAIRQESRKQRH